MRKSVLTLIVASAILFSGCGKSLEDRAKEKFSTMTEMAEIGTVEYTISKIIKASDSKFYTIGDRKILFSCSATMKAGVDMTNFSAEQVVIKDKEITINLPKARVLSFNMPPEKAKLEYEKVGALHFDFTAEDRNNLLRQGEEDILADAPNLGILEDAEMNARMFFEALLSQVGFEKINVVFNEE